MDIYSASTPVSPTSHPVSGNNSPYTTYTRPVNHHRKRISALRLSSDTTSTLPEYIPTNPASPPLKTISAVTEIDDAPPGYSSDSAQEADEDTDISDDGRRKHQRSVFVPPSPTPSGSRFKRVPSHRRKSSALNLDTIRSSSDLYLDSLLERSVHALEMSNALLQSSISTKTSLSGILHQETDDEADFPNSEIQASSSRSGSRSGMYSLERSARGLSSRITSTRDVHETWVEDLEQITRDVDTLFSEEAQEKRRHQGQMRRNGSGSGSSQGSISASVPTTSVLHTRSHPGHSQLRAPKRPSRRASLDFHSIPARQPFVEHLDHHLHVEHPERHDDMIGVPHLRYDSQDRERFIAQPPRALTQYVVAEGDLRHGHEQQARPTCTDAPTYAVGTSWKDCSRERAEDGEGRRNSKNSHDAESESNDDDQTIVLPSTLGLRSSGTHSTLRGSRRTPSRSQSKSPIRTVSRFVHHSHREQELAEEPSTPPVLAIGRSSSSSPHQPTRAPNAYTMLSSFVYPSSTPQHPNSASENLHTKGKRSPFGSSWESRGGSANSPAAERHRASKPSGSQRRHSASPAASTVSTTTSSSTKSGGSGSSTSTVHSISRSRSQTPKPLESGFTFLPQSGRRNMTPPLEVSGSGGEGEGRSSMEGSVESFDSCPTKQTIISLRKILDTHQPPLKPSEDWTLISKPPQLLRQSMKVGLPVEAGTSTATASISKLFTRGIHSHEGSVTRQRLDDQRQSSFKGKGKASATEDAPGTPTIITPVETPTRMSFSKSIPELLGNSVALALRASSPLSSKPSSGYSTPLTPGHSKRISFAELPEGTQGIGPERTTRKRRGKQRASSSRSGKSKSSGRRSGRGSEDESDEPRGWLSWLIGVSAAETGRSDKVDERLGKGWASLNGASRGFDEWGI